MNQKFYKIKCSSEISIHKSDEIYINSNFNNIANI